MKTLLLRLLIGTVLILVMGFRLQTDDVLTHNFIVQPSSSLTINGKTNVNSYKCATTRYTRKDTLILVEGSRRRPYFKRGYVGLDAASFDCGMRVMTNDFSSTIKAKEFPVIFIEFISFERIPTYSKAEDKFKSKMKISLGGVTKTFQVDCTIKPEPTGLIHLRGGRSFTFSDFNLVAPEKMMGMIKVEDALDVNFHLVLLLDTES